jgi:POT family proton-dependent oligopeptide transporter
MADSPNSQPQNTGRRRQGGYLTTPPNSKSMPGGIPYIIGNEAAERFSFYGMRAILAVFMTEYLLDASGQLAPMDEHTANEWQHTFVAAVYFFPILGAVFADWLFGKYRTILLVSLIYCAGHAMMAVVDSPQTTGIEPRTALFIALCLIAIGSGGIKPCVSAHVGDQFSPQNSHLLSRVFGWFYFSINLGSAASTLLIPELLKRYGPGVAFAVPGILMGLATCVFWMGRNKFVHIPPGGKKFFSETFSPDGLRAIANLIPLYLLIAMFWCLFDQTQSAWIHQAKEMNRFLYDFESFGQQWRWEVLPSQIQAINPILVMLFIPIFTYLVYPLMGRFFTVTPLRKIGIGLFVTVPSFMLTGWIEWRLDHGEQPYIGWQILAYVIITAAEIMISITAIEFSYTQAPKKMKSFIMGLFLLSVALGNFFTAYVNRVIVAETKKGNTLLDGANYYWFFTALMLLTAVAYVIWSQFYRGQKYIQGE